MTGRITAARGVPPHGLRMGLRRYAEKRDFTRTPEPAPVAARPRRSGGLRFTVQKHAASHLHYDFRLELGGVMKSWAVPKGPSLNPADKRLAMEVEDHPVSYGDFEGTIPKGQYGGGTVLLWDTGTWTPLDDDPERALRKGSLKFELHGEKLKGSWALVRAFKRDTDDRKNSWLLIKHKDKAARTGKPIIETKPLSVKTGRSLDQIAADPGSAVHESNRNGRASETTGNGPARARRAAAAKPIALGAGDVRGAKRGPMRRDYQPQLCVLADRVPDGPEWLHEIKYDGYRFLAYRRGGEVTLTSRRGHDWTDRFRPLADAVAALPMGDAVIDGEAAVLDARGRTSFQKLQQAVKDRRFERLAFYVFDLLYAEGHDLTRAPLLARKELLRKAVPDDPASLVTYSDHVLGGGGEVRSQACRLGLEGIISKRTDAPYAQARSPTWLKIKCGLRQEFVVVGYTDPEGARSHFGSLLLAARDESGRLVHTGRVGTGFNERLLKSIAGRFKPRARPALDVIPPRDQVRGAHWVEPELVAEVSFTEWTEDGRLRHPSFEGLREDKPASEVRIERPRETEIVAADLGAGQPARAGAAPNARRARAKPKSKPKPRAASERPGPVEVEGVVITNPDRVLYPEIGLTKLGLVRYHERAAGYSLPYLVDRPLSTVRCPSGREGECFFQKHVRDIFTEPVKPLRVKEKKGYEDFISIVDKAGLIKLAQLGVLEIHPWGSRRQTFEQPDTLTFDLDPGPGVTFADIKAGARRVREVLEAVGLETFIKTSGGKGLHIVVPLTPKAGWDVVKEFAAAVALRMATDEPDKYVANMSKARRGGKIFVDYLRNGRGATSIAAYSPRAREFAPVSMPIAWEDLARLKSPAQYTVENTPAHLARRRKDPWARFAKVRQTLPG